MRTRLVALALVLLVSPGVRADDKDGSALQGTWLPSAAEIGGMAFPDEVRKTIALVIEEDRYTATVGKQVDRGTVKLNPSAKPKEKDVTGTDGPNKGKTILAICELGGDTLRVCYDLGGKGRPTEFKTTEGTRLLLVTCKRKKP